MSRDSFISGGRKGNAKTDSHIRSKKQEEEWAKRTEGRKVPGSGSGLLKGDVSSGLTRLECKTTSKKSFSVTREMIAKIEEAALAHGQVPAIIVEFNENGKKVAEVAVVPTWAIECQDEEP